jgi:hypothetical protein
VTQSGFAGGVTYPQTGVWTYEAPLLPPLSFAAGDYVWSVDLRMRFFVRGIATCVIDYEPGPAWIVVKVDKPLRRYISLLAGASNRLLLVNATKLVKPELLDRLAIIGAAARKTERWSSVEQVKMAIS